MSLIIYLFWTLYFHSKISSTELEQKLFNSYYFIVNFDNTAFSALTLLVVCQEEHPARKKIECWGTGVVICLECGANDLHMVQLMPMPSHHVLLQ